MADLPRRPEAVSFSRIAIGERRALCLDDFLVGDGSAPIAVRARWLQSMALRVTRPGFLRGIGRNDDPVQPPLCDVKRGRDDYIVSLFGDRFRLRRSLSGACFLLGLCLLFGLTLGRCAAGGD